MVVHGPYPIAEPRVVREVEAAVKAGYEVDVVAMRRHGELGKETSNGVRIFRLPLSHRRGASSAGVVFEYCGFTMLAALLVAALCARRRYAVVQVHNPPDFLIIAGALPKLLGSRVVLDIHDLSPDMFNMRFDGRTARIGGTLLRAIERRAAAFADSVITVHEPYRRELVARGVDGEKITVVMNSVDERILPSTAPSTEHAGFRIVYHGTVTQSYGLNIVVDAVAEIASTVSDVRLEIYGEGDATEAVRQRAANRGIAAHLHLTGSYLPHEEVLARVCGAAVGVIPNLPSALNRFALSSKLFEYVALGIPVVSADLPTLREHFSDSEVLFFRAGNSHSLAEALLEVARNRDSAAERASAARGRYENYRWTVNAARYTELLESLRGRTPGGV
jgi:glycosyltransferase involved in cell wall biosynthesis